MADSPAQCISTLSKVALFLSGLRSARRLFKDHRAPAVGLFLLACSAAVGVLPGPLLAGLQRDVEWAGYVVGPALVSFGYLWLSEDRGTAYMLLGGLALLAALRDRLSEETVAVLSRCVALSSLASSLTVCLFTASFAGALGSLALSLPALLGPEVRDLGVIPLFTVKTSEAILSCLMSLGSLATERALRWYQLELKGGC
ncbi:transmembrane protein 276-like [Amia ocellicauda]|uniref:transmembrane protein 276-like n=1 Tax=Amia ocellicauda TaxID=2972642 RepID=UPI0034640B66